MPLIKDISFKVAILPNIPSFCFDVDCDTDPDTDPDCDTDTDPDTDCDTDTDPDYKNGM